MITAQIVSIPERVDLLKIACESLLPQVDRLYVALNNYKEKPSFLDTGWVNIQCELLDNSLQDGAKFMNAKERTPNGIILICDDDIEYPPDYAHKMSTILDNKYGDRPTFISCMGKNLKGRPIKSYYTDYTDSYRTFADLRDDKEVDVIGSASLAYRSNYIDIDHKDMLINHGDLCVSAYARKNGIRMVTVAHSGLWLHNLMPMLPKGSPCVFDQYKGNDKVLVDFINQYL